MKEAQVTCRVYRRKRARESGWRSPDGVEPGPPAIGDPGVRTRSDGYGRTQYVATS
jgi:hypothetical protein